MKLAVRTPGSILYPSLTSDWERELDWRGIRRFAQRADALGFDWLWVAEHVV
jgi:alkanesulfonate monooxygenase SsuD/methylene tetrahydromethanopterin reductase-like flavin-dependent oxidoreductase (luciferase family)